MDRCLGFLWTPMDPYGHMALDPLWTPPMAWFPVDSFMAETHVDSPKLDFYGPLQIGLLWAPLRTLFRVNPLGSFFHVRRDCAHL